MLNLPLEMRELVCAFAKIKAGEGFFFLRHDLAHALESTVVIYVELWFAVLVFDKAT